MAKNVIIFGTHMSSSVLVNNKAKNILFLGGGLTQELDGATLTLIWVGVLGVRFEVGREG